MPFSENPATVQSDGKPGVSVIIATKNRDEALKSISLPSLLEQDDADFEVVLWDASDSARSLEVADAFKESFARKGTPLRCFTAPRQGSASQRNDAVLHSKGAILFFIDDDSRVSPDGIRGLRECFASDASTMGAGLTVQELQDGRPSRTTRFSRLKEKVYRALGYTRRRVVSLSGAAKGISAPAGPAEWLSGCSMAFRREVFDRLRFNEKLEAFGPYAMFEDIEFSCRVVRNWNTPLMIASRGSVVHHAVAGERIAGDERRAAMFFYNRYTAMKAASWKRPLLGRCAYSWSVLRTIVKLSRADGFPVALRGFATAMRQIRSECRDRTP